MLSLRNPRGRCSGLETHYQSAVRWKFGVLKKASGKAFGRTKKEIPTHNGTRKPKIPLLISRSSLGDGGDFRNSECFAGLLWTSFFFKC